ncbi:FxSxx-COOH system tetratricopeptide repeat protein [Hamadaea tsunoensis]|uniref:FxSxx-COOH system tetratricopeptide repeat protein n=1 Tax=Hamadaea tsunoensis TaxID=53368 RepID=UPI0004166F90|nr:FxSxx-COOH system tetratricopeptide repeat protein [Hamadaea tsunoensis]
MDNRRGQVVTFYSYKGGVGRTMALANVAWILAANGKRVLAADWDLESPGLYRFFHPFLDAYDLAGTGGIIDLIREYEWAATRRVPRREDWYAEYARVARWAVPLTWEFPGGGGIDFLPAGRQNNEYTATLNNMDWDTFHDHLGGGQFLDALRADMKAGYDYALIDSRTGYSDVADICAIHLPDTLVDCFTYSEQSIVGAVNTARKVRDRYRARNIRVLPVPMRVDPAEKVKAEIARQVATRRFAGFPDLPEPERSAYWAEVGVPYQSYYAFEETLATFADRPGEPRSLLRAYERLTGLVSQGEVAALPPMDDDARVAYSRRFTRRYSTVEEEIVLRYEPADQVWAEWAGDLLRSAGVRVHDPRAAATGRTPAARELIIVSHADWPRDVVTAALPGPAASLPFIVHVNHARPAGPYPGVSVYGLAPRAAAERLLVLVGHTGGRPDPFSARYPGHGPAVFGVPGRNPAFTGRESALATLRDRLRADGPAADQPTRLVALCGMGGVGKTQLAIEYAHRFRSSYDVVWWIRAEPATFADAELADLGTRLGVPGSEQRTVAGSARAALVALEKGDFGRWLLIFDSAEDVERIRDFLPRSGGSVLITSRARSWAEIAYTLGVDVFSREESVTHLRQRVAGLGSEPAARVAEMLGDLPIAVAAAGAWLADSGVPVESYVAELTRVGQDDPAVQATWDLSLERLRGRSPAAFRLLQLCSVLAPEVSLDLVYGDEMAAALRRVEGGFASRIGRGKLVQENNRLALLKVDAQSNRVLVHRLLQQVVRGRMSAAELGQTRHEAHLVLAASRPGGSVDDPETWPRLQLLWPHVAATEAMTCPDPGVRDLLVDQVRYLYLRGDLDGGARLAAQVIAEWARKPADEVLTRQLLQIRFNLANILRRLGRYAEAYTLDEEVLADQGRLFGAADPDALMTAGGLAADLRALGRYADSLARDEATYAAWREDFGDDHPRTLVALNNLASAYRLMGDFREARVRDQAVYSRYRVVLGDKHPNTLLTASNLARDLRDAGEYADSIVLLESVIRLLQENAAETVRDTLNAHANKAVSLRAAGRTAEAARLLDDAYEELDKMFGPTAPDTLACRMSRAAAVLALGEPQRAAAEFRAVRRAYEETLGADHPHTLICLSNLAAAERSAGHLETAAEYAYPAVAGLERVLGPDHPSTLAAGMNQAIVTAESGDPDAARILLEPAAVRLTARLGADHPDAIRCEANLAMVRDRLRFPDAGTRLDRALQRLADRLGPEHPTVEAFRAGAHLHRVVEPHPH